MVRMNVLDLKSRSFHVQTQRLWRSFGGIICFLVLIPLAKSAEFNFSSFQPNIQGIFFEGDAFAASGVIHVTKNQRDSSLLRSVGRASYAKPIQIWDRSSGKLADFTTHFTFIINALNVDVYGHGLAFFLEPLESLLPANSTGGCLGLFSNCTTLNPAGNQVVAVEFDTFKDPWDPDSDHVGININSIDSVAKVQWNSSIKKGSKANAWVSYNSSTQNLSVFLTYADHPTFRGNSSLSYILDLRDILPERVSVGFSAATGQEIELHTILTWHFSSTLEIAGGKWKDSLVIGLCVGIGALNFGFGLLWFIRWKKKGKRGKKELAIDDSVDKTFEKGTGPKRFTFHELIQATDNFAEERKLGEGGFGSVYRGLLSETNMKVAVKRVSQGSKQGKKEYVSEVRIISRLRHRNLVQLIGWYHGHGEFLLVYEFLPNGSLESHLFGKKPTLPWQMRYKIALGLASSLLYLHEEWEECVLHRDVKSSNVMLDSNYNAKLGDFGLARLIDHALGSQTTALAGTMGYLAPECVTTGKASRKSDVYSFGAVALEIACGRRAIEPKAGESMVRLVEWVWDLYGKRKLLDATDKQLRSQEFDQRQMEYLMVVGLWCCHPDHEFRPSMRQVINVLNFVAPLPSLPSKHPVPIYFAPPMHMCRFSYTSSASHKDSGRCHCCSSCSSSVSSSAG